MPSRYCYDVWTNTSHYTGEVSASSESQARSIVRGMYPNAVSIDVWEK